ncbi:MAG: hypothetical protein IJ874_00025 [Ruminococcus sp.]|nr:hypothetical protein [Ruminococcus sp.]
MTGNGTIADPYIITTAAELYSMGETGSADTCFALGCDIDLNGTPMADSFTPITLRCGSLDGRGHTIRNIVKKLIGGTAYIFTVHEDCEAVEISGLRLDNVRLTASNVNIFSGTAAVTLRSCSFAVRAVFAATPTADIYFFGGVTVNAELCSFAFDIKWVQQKGIMLGGSLDRCQLRLNLQADTLYSSTGSAVSGFRSVTITDTYFMGKITTSASSKIFVMLAVCTLCNSYFVFTSDGTANITATTSNRLLTPCFFDSSVRGSGTLTFYNFKSLTTEQCQDAEYLRSIGFDCGGGGSGT